MDDEAQTREKIILNMVFLFLWAWMENLSYWKTGPILN